MKTKAIFFLVLLILAAHFDVGAGQTFKDPLRIAIDKGYLPQTFLNVDGEPTGIFVDIWRLWSQKTGKDIKFITGNWKDTLTNLKNGKADIHSGLFYSDSRAKWIRFSQPFYGVGSYLFFKAGSKGIDSRGDLTGKKIGATRGSFQEEYLRKEYPNVEVVPFTDRETMVRAVLAMKIDALLAEGPAMTGILGGLGLTGQFETSSVLFRKSFHAGVIKENNALLLLIDKGLDAISNQELAEIEKRWIPDPHKQYFKASAAKIRLTEREKAWLNEHSPVSVGFPSDFPPLFFKEDDVIKGINPDYLRLVGVYSGLQFDFIRIPSQNLDDFLRTSKIDMSVAFDISERKTYVSNTQPFMNITMVVVGRKDMPLISGLNALNGKKIAVVKGIKIYSRILKDYPGIERYPTDTFKAALEAVASGRAEAVMVGMPMVGYLLHDYPGLKILGLVDIPPEPYMYAVRKDFPELVSIVNKAIAAIPKEETDAIVQKWFKVQIEHKTDWSIILRWVGGISVVFLLILFIFLYWNKRLVREIKERKRAEEALRESEEKYRRIFENIQDVYYDSSLDGTILEISPSIENVSQYKRKELIGRSLYDIYTNPKERDGFLKLIFDKGKVNDFEISLTDKDGSKHSCSITTLLVKDEQGNPIKLVGSMRDISERKQDEEERKKLEEQLHRAQKMEAMGLLAGGVAHDLNNILSGIVSYPELLLMDLPKDSPLRRPIETIKESGMKAADVVEDLLTIARGVATGKEVLNLNSSVNEYLGSAEHQNLEKTHSFIDFKTELDPDLLNMMGSPTHIKKTLMNLIMNASEAIEGGGTVTISTTSRYLDEPLKGYEDVRTGEYTVLGVSDDGSGIAPEDLERIFEPFYTKKVMGRSGTGLGLAVVWNTVQDQKGYINVKSSDKGTVFELYFPVTREEIATEQEEVPLEDYLGNGEKILVVDDEERQREIACGILTKLGYIAEAVSSGEEAIEYMKGNAVDLIVLDMVMPKGINGRETYEQIIKIRPGQKAIIASGFSETEEVKMAQKLGAGKYIKKPYVLEKIGIAIKEELEK